MLTLSEYNLLILSSTCMSSGSRRDDDTAVFAIWPWNKSNN